MYVIKEVTMSDIKQYLLMKSKRDLSKLVKVQRQVSRGGKVFSQYFYVKPSDVKTTDKVVGGQQNLIKPPAAQTSLSTGLDINQFNILASSDKAKALEYLKSCGIQWKEHSHAGINWMRAKQALQAISAQSNALGNNTQNQSSTSNSGQNLQPKNDIKDMLSKLTSVQKELNDELAKCTNSKEKVIVLKSKLGVDGCKYFADSNNISWAKSDNAAVDWMRLSMALKTYYDKLDVSLDKLKTTSKDKDAKKFDPSLKIPSKATERQKNIINILNTIYDENELQAYADTGMVPEDDVAKSFILDKLAPKFKDFSTNNDKHFPVSASGIAEQIIATTKATGVARTSIRNGFTTMVNEFNMAMFVNPRSQMTPISHTNFFNSGINTQSLMTRLNNAFDTYTTNKFSNKADDNTSTDTRGFYMTNMGYTGEDPAEYKERYNLDNEGFVLALKSIKAKYPELSSKCDEMVSDYDNVMNIVGGNRNLLERLLRIDSWDETTEDFSDFASHYSPSIYDFITPGRAKVCLKELDNQYQALLKIKEQYDLSDEDMLKMTKSYTTSSVKVFKGRNLLGEINLTEYMKANGLAYTASLDSGYNQYEKLKFDMLIANVYRITGKELIDKKTDYANNNIPVHLDKASMYRQLEQISSISESDFKKVHSLVNKMFGYQYEDNNGKVVDVNSVDAPNFFTEIRDLNVLNVEDADKDLVLSNLLSMSLDTAMKKSVTEDVHNSTINSINDQGTDFSKNYSYYYPTFNQMKKTVRSKQGTYSPYTIDHPSYSVNELNDIIKNQVANSVTFSPDYINDVRKYYSKYHKGDELNASEEATFLKMGSEITNYAEHPMKDVLYSYTTSTLRYIPRMQAGKGVDDKVANSLLYTPFKFDSSDNKNVVTVDGYTASANKLLNIKRLREKAFKSVHCSVATEDEDTSTKMRKEFLDNWDYKDGEKTPDGFTKNKMYSGSNSWKGYDRRALFNSRFFKVNNSNMHEGYAEYKKKLETDYPNTKRATDELELYHACSYASTAGILGKTGGWFMGNEYTKTAKALGEGAYFGYKGAKSSVYCGEGKDGYHNTSTTGMVGDNANGCYIMATVMRGVPFKDSKSDRGTFRDYELVVKNNKCILPHHFVDISARCLGVNVKRDSAGNYLDMTTDTVTHDKYGRSVNMK